MAADHRPLLLAHVVGASTITTGGRASRPPFHAGKMPALPSHPSLTSKQRHDCH